MAAPDRAAFVQSLAPLAERWAQRTGIPVSMWLAMAASESNWGAAGNALFGIKGRGSAGSLNSPTWESQGGQRVNTSADFAQYNTPDEAFQAFWNLVRSSPRYAEAMSHLPDDPRGFLQSINEAGYATDPNWASSIESLARNQIDPILGTSKGGLRQGGAAGIGPLSDAELADAMNPDTTGQSPDTAASAYGDTTAATTAAAPDNGPAGNISPGGYAPKDWASLVQAHQGVVSVGATKQAKVPNPNGLPGETMLGPDPNAPSIVAFGDGTVVLARFGGEAANPTTPVQVMPWSGTKAAAGPKYLGSSPTDKYIVQIDPQTGKITSAPNPNYVPPAAKTTVSGASAADQYILQTDPATGAITQLPNPNYVPPKPQLIQQGDGAVFTFNPETGQLTQVKGPDAIQQRQADLAAQEAALRIATAQRAIMPAQQRLFQDAYATIDMIRQKLASGQIQPAEANKLINEIHQNLEASLQGTTLFDEKKQQDLVKQQQAVEAASLLRQRVQEGATLAHSLLSAAAGHVLMPAGATTLGIDPYAIAKAETTDLGGGADLFAKASALLGNYLSGGGPASPAAGSPSSALGAAAPAPAAPSPAGNALLGALIGAVGRAPAGVPSDAGLNAEYGQNGGGIPPNLYTPSSLEGPSVQQQALAPRGPAILQALLQSALGGAGRLS